jgi:hypothetical protein
MYPFVSPKPKAHKAVDNNQRYHYNRRSNCHAQLLATWMKSRQNVQQKVSLNVTQPVVFVFQEEGKLFVSAQILLSLDSKS